MNQRNKDFCSKYWHFLLIFDNIAFVQCNICNDIFCFDLMFRGWVTSYGRGRRGYQTLLDFQGLYEFRGGRVWKKRNERLFFFFGCYATYVQELFFKFLLDDFVKCELDVGRTFSIFSILLFWCTYIGLLYIYTGNTYILNRNSMSAYTNVIVFATCIISVIFLNYREVTGEIIFVFWEISFNSVAAA